MHLQIESLQGCQALPPPQHLAPSRLGGMQVRSEWGQAKLWAICLVQNDSISCRRNLGRWARLDEGRGHSGVFSESLPIRYSLTAP